MTNWQEFANTAFSWTGAALIGFGTTLGLGGGSGLITLLHHMPPPYEDQVWLAWPYDALQDRAKNVEKVGARRKRVVKELPKGPDAQ